MQTFCVCNCCADNCAINCMRDAGAGAPGFARDSLSGHRRLTTAILLHTCIQRVLCMRRVAGPSADDGECLRWRTAYSFWSTRTCCIQRLYHGNMRRSHLHKRGVLIIAIKPRKCYVCVCVCLRASCFCLMSMWLARILPEIMPSLATARIDRRPRGGRELS